MPAPSPSPSPSPSAPRSLPPRPDLRRLKDEAKRRTRAGEFAALSDAQLAVAREHGHASWPRLKRAVEAARLDRDERVAAFLDAAVPRPRADHRGGGLERAEALRGQAPALDGADVYVQAVLGDEEGLRGSLARRPELAAAPGGPRDWPPLLYACFSRYLRLEREDREPGFDGVVAALLAAGADPNASFHNPDDPVGRETALYGAAGVAGSAALSARLLDAGADPDDEEVAYHIVETGSADCLRAWLAADPAPELLLTALLRTIDHDEPELAELLLEAGADPSGVGRWGLAPLHMAVTRHVDPAWIDLLHDAGADLDAPAADGRSAYALALRHGQTALAARLEALGAHTALGPRDAFLAACAAGDEAAAREALAARPALLDEMAPEDHALLAQAAKDGRRDALRLMLALGFDLNAGEHGYTALHQAAFGGHTEVVEDLLAAGADPARRDPHYRATPWGWAGAGGHPALRERLLEAAGDQPIALVARGADDRLAEQLAEDPARAAEGDGWATPLSTAAELGRTEAARLLLAAGADPAAPAGDGRGPRAIAEDAGHDALAALLRAAGG